MGKTKRKLKTETMSDDCFFNPAACEAAAAEEEDTTMMEEQEMDEGMESDDDMDKEMDMTPQITFLLTALGAAGFSAADLFWRRHAVQVNSEYNTDGDTDDMPLWFIAETTLAAGTDDYSSLWW